MENPEYTDSQSGRVLNHMRMIMRDLILRSWLIPVLLTGLLIATFLLSQVSSAEESVLPLLNEEEEPEPDRGSVDSRDIDVVSRLLAIQPKGFSPVNGSWQKYALIDLAHGTRREFRIGVAGQTVGKSGLASWIEITTTDSRSARLTIKFLYEPGARYRTQVTRLIVKIADHPAVEFRSDDDKVILLMESDAKIEFIGNERIEIEAGEFEAEHVRLTDDDERDVDQWYASGIAPFCLVQSRTPTQELRLLEHGVAYRPLITEEPFLLDHPHRMGR